MYPGTIFEYEDRSTIAALPIEAPVNKPIFMTGFTSDKGTEDFTVIEGEDFFKQYGENMSTAFAKHGQPLLQATNIINAGGRLYCKRVVASDAMLANLGVIANVKSAQAQKTDAEGNLLYTDAATGLETTISEGNEPVMLTSCNVSFELKTIESSLNDPYDVALRFDAANNAMANVEPGQDGSYPLFVITDNGRGLSRKKFRITPDYSSSRALEYMKYNLEILEGNTVLETIPFALNPTIIDVTTDMSIQGRVMTNSSQVKCVMFQNNILAMYKNVATIAGLEDVDSLLVEDVLFGKTRKAETIPGIVVVGDVALDNVVGMPLSSGSNGSFGDAPIAAESYGAEMVKVFDGTYDEIYNLDNIKIDAIVDANYPAEVKRAIEGLVTFREDCFYFRDLGLRLKSVEEIKDADKNSTKNKFCSSYHNSYDIIDPYSRKQITVTIMYDFARVLVNHFIDGRSRPLAGHLHSFTFPNAIPGTINFVPKITPAFNQKEQLDDLRINYAGLFDGVLTMETLYTSQEKHTQFSYINNILAVQEVIKAIRTRCPKIRYSFMTGADLIKYKDDVQNVINKFTGNFEEITLEYIQDATYVANKIFYAAIKVKFKNFVQTEIFKVIALPTE